MLHSDKIGLKMDLNPFSCQNEMPYKIFGIHYNGFYKKS